MRRKLLVAAEAWELLAARGKLWLLPLLLAMLAVGGLLLAAQTSVLGPLLYTLF